MKEANRLIEGFLRTQDHAAYIDVASPMLDNSGRLSSDLFVSDGLHPSAKCYALWTSLSQTCPGAAFSAFKDFLSIFFTERSIGTSCCRRACSIESV
jgi:hypothetical protein